MGPASAVVGVRGRLRARPVAVERRILELYVEGKAVPRHPRGKRGAFGVLDAIWEEQGGDRYARLSGYAAELALFHSVNGLPNRAKPQFEMLDRIATALEKNTTFFRYNPVDGEAKADVRELIAEQSRDERDHLRLVMSVAAAAAHFANDEPRLKRYAAAGDPHSSGAHLQARRMMDPSRPWESPPIEDGHWADHMALFDAARSGDGKDVAALLATQHATGAETLPRIVPRLRTGEDALLRWFDERFPEPALNAGASVFLGHLTDRRVVARLVGRPQEADVLAPAVERFVDALTDPVIAYELDELETFFAPRQH